MANDENGPPGAAERPRTESHPGDDAAPDLGPILVAFEACAHPPLPFYDDPHFRMDAPLYLPTRTTPLTCAEAREILTDEALLYGNEDETAYATRYGLTPYGLAMLRHEGEPYSRFVGVAQYLARERPRRAAWAREKARRAARTHFPYRPHVSRDKYEQMFAAQQGQCAGCTALLLRDQNTHVDHCHSTNKVRGLLCRSCNWCLGHAKDDPATLRRLADYLERSRG